MKKLFAIFLVIMALLAAACGGSSKPADTKTQGKGKSISQTKDIKAAISVDFTTMDPQDTNDNLSAGVQRLMMDSLFGFDDTMKVFPMLATGYKANEHATEFTVSLRKGIKFTDGEAFNADVVLANAKKWTGKDGSKLKCTSLVAKVIKSVDKIDDYTVKFVLNKPYGAFIPLITQPAFVMMSPKVLAKGNEACAHGPIGTGQYKYVEWIAGDHLKIELNKDWWGYDPKICGGKALADKDAGFKSITFKPVGESATRVAMVQSGDAQFMWPVPTENVKTLADNKKIRLFKEESIVVNYLMMNNQKKPFNDKRVRQAMNYAINKEAYVKVVANGLGSVATSVIGPKVTYYKANKPAPYDVAKAKELLKEAGYPNGFTTDIMFASTTANQKQAEFYKQQLAQVGITLNLKGMEKAILSQKLFGVNVPGDKAEVNTYAIGWSPSEGDADGSIRPLLAEASVPPYSYNVCYYINPELEKYIAQGLSSADPKVRQAAYDKAQDLIWEDVPLICIMNTYNTLASSANITGVNRMPVGELSMRNAKMFE